LIRLRDGGIDVRKTRGRIDWERDGPASDAKEDVRFAFGQANDSTLWQFSRTEDGRSRHEHGFLPGKLKAALNEQLPAIRRDDLALFAAQLDAVERQAP